MIDAEPIGTYTSGRQNCVCLVYCDTQADLPGADDFTCHMMLGSRAEVMDGTVWRMKSDGTWEQQPAPNTTQLDLSGYYTAAQADAAIAAAIRANIVGTDIPANYDLDLFVDVGHKNCTAVNAQTCANRPLGAQNGGFGVTNSLIYTAAGSADRVRQELIYNVTGSNVARNRTFWRYLSSAGWSGWYEVTTAALA